MQLPSAIALGIDQFGTMRSWNVERRDRRREIIAERWKRSMRHSTPRLHLEHLAGGDLRERAGELGEFGGLEDFGPCFAVDLAVLLGDQRGELGDVLFEERLVLVEDLDPLLDGRRGPGRPRLLRGLGTVEERLQGGCLDIETRERIREPWSAGLKNLLDGGERG